MRDHQSPFQVSEQLRLCVLERGQDEAGPSGHRIEGRVDIHNIAIMYNISTMLINIYNILLVY